LRVDLLDLLAFDRADPDRRSQPIACIDVRAQYLPVVLALGYDGPDRNAHV